MPAGKGTVLVRILGDATGFQKEMAQADATAASFGSKLSGLGPTAAIAGAAVAGGVAAIGVGLFKIGESFDEAYDKIRVGTGATGDQLKTLEGDFKTVVSSVPTDFGKASDAITLVVQKLGLSGPSLDTVSEQFLELSRITKTDLAANLTAGTDVLNRFGVAAADQPAKLDELFRASQASGVSFADLASQMTDAGTQLQALGFNFDQAATLVAGLGKAGIDVSDVLPALSKTMAVGAKEGKDAQTVYQELFQSIKNAPDDTAAAKIAFDELGAKAGPKFAALIREGKLGLDSFGETIAEGSETIIGAGKDTQDFGEKWTLFKDRVLVALEPLALAVFNGIGDAMDKLGPIVDQLSFAFGADGLSGVFDLLKQRFDDLSPKVKLIIEAFGIFAAAMLAIVAPGLVVAAAIAALVAGIIYAYNNFETFRTVVDAVASFLGDVVVPAIVAFTSAVAEQVAHLADWWREHWGAIQEAVGHVVVAIHDVIDWFVNAVEEIWDAFGDTILTAVRVVWEQIRAQIEWVLGVIRGVIDIVLSLINGDWGEAWNGILEIVSATWAYIVATVSGALDLLQTVIGDALETIVAYFGGLPGRIWAVLQSLPGILAGVASAAFNAFLSASESAVVGLIGWFSGLPGRFASAAGNIFGFIADDFKAAVNAVIGAWNRLEIPSFHIHVTMPSAIPNIDFDTPSIPFPDIPYLAMGGVAMKGGLAVVGEHGKELVELPEGAKVQPLTGTNAIGRNAPLIGEWHSHGVDAAEIVDELEWSVKAGTLKGAA